MASGKASRKRGGQAKAGAPARARPPARSAGPRDGDRCTVVAGRHAGKEGIVRDVRTSPTGHVTITVVQPGGERFKTLARHVAVVRGR